MASGDRIPDFDGCRVVDRLSSGPVSDLYRAIQQPLGRPVLIKALSSSILPSSPFATSLEREARLLAEMRHPGILAVHDYVRREDRMWLVLEFVEGDDLEDLLATHGPLTPTAVAALGLQLARALEHAHSHGVIHRDVRPSNVLVAKSGDVKLVNFAVATDQRLPTAPELLDGKANPTGPNYLSPEQILGEAPDPRSDLFSLGVVLYEALAGKRPFEGPDPSSTTVNIRQSAPAPLSRAVPDVPPPLARIISRCLEKMPADRFASSTELALALEQTLGDAAASPSRAVLRGLAAVGARDDAPPESVALSPHGPPTGALGAWPTIRALCVLAFVGSLGAGAIWVLESRAPGAPRPATAQLELAPKHPAFLRVVADPWADVVIDGQKVETTPFAKAIPIAPGTHYVRLEHPNAPVERRTLHLVAGESVLLDVKMQVAAAPPTASASAAPPTPEDNSP
ncbi:MAG: serine/threonine-protein kinase [Polyangiaceae bacterium]